MGPPSAQDPAARPAVVRGLRPAPAVATAAAAVAGCRWWRPRWSAPTRRPGCWPPAAVAARDRLALAALAGARPAVTARAPVPARAATRPAARAAAATSAAATARVPPAAAAAPATTAGPAPR